jgi:subtilisin family serine protease
MKALRWGCPAKGCGLLLGLLLWCLLSSPTASQDLATRLYTLKMAIPESQRRIASSLRAAAEMVGQNGMATARAQLGKGLRLRSPGAVEVFIYASALTPDMLNALRQHGVGVLRTNEQFAMVYAAVPFNALEAVAALPSVRWVGSPVYSVQRTGSVTSEGDQAMRADLVRSMFGVTGKGVKVGIIADSLCDPATSINSGDLPATLTIVNGQNGCANPAAFDEGRALAEIVYDLAPGVDLLFRTGFPTSLDFIAAVQELTAAGAQVIVDDLGFFNEPIFEEGPVAQTVRQAIQQGVVFVSAAGNDALRHYQGIFKEFDSTNLHDFGGGDTRLDVRIAANATVVVFLQWANPFDGSANTADYDLLLVDTAGNTLAISNENQLAMPSPPLEHIVFTNTTGQSMTVGVVVSRAAGPALPFSLSFNTFGSVMVLKHDVASSSIFGHPCVRDVLAVGAVNVQIAGFSTLEGFSSQGPCELFFPTHEFRTKPDVAAADGVSTSLSDFTPFFGTSAAAPHVAAVAALLMEAAGGPGAVSNTHIANTLRLAAVDRGTAGVDNSFGYGVVDALLAVQTLRAPTSPAPRSVIDAPGADLLITPDTAVTFQGHCVDIEGDQSFTFAWSFGGVAPPATVQNPGDIIFPTAGVFPITFTCTDAMGRVDPAPATRTVTVDSPPKSQIISPPADVMSTVGTSMNFAGTCTDPENDVPFTFLWNFGGSASPSTSTEQNPQGVVFNTAGTFTVSFACTDALGITDPNPATVHVTVSPVMVARSSGGGGGGGCTMRPGGQARLTGLVDISGNMLLPVLVLGIIRILSRIKRSYRSSPPFHEGGNGTRRAGKSPVHKECRTVLG